MTVQLIRIPNAQFAGGIMAEGNGLFRAAGPDVTPVPGARTAVPEPAAPT